jgi:HD-like signal output (HDOD) protein
MVLALSVINTLSIQEKGELRIFWYHSFYAALCTKYLATKYEPQLSFEELWSAGMLHDIGKLVYLRFFPEHYKAIRQLSTEKGYFFSEAEQELQLPASAYLGILLCDHWRLPAKIRDACEAHSLEHLQALKGTGSAESFKRMISLGNLTAILSVNTLSSETKSKIARAISTAFGCSETEFLALMGEIYDLRIQVDRFMEQFG